uniref:Minichromosome loss protein Mcl1 middle region domain-containing protein n=1 Tax=Parascaris univalens TaxID=6257 RepID=A0A915BV01_PARUN
DHILKVIQLESGNYVRLECEGQIMCVRIDPNGELLAVSASDGILRIYPIAVVSGASPIRSIRISSRIPDIEDCSPGQPRLEISWAVDGTYLFSVVLGGVKRFKRESFDDPSSFIASSSVTEMFSTCCISSCGKFVAASSMGGTICVWNVESGELLSSCKYVRLGETKVITSMIWHPILYGTLFFADSEEHICSLSNCVKEPISNSDSSDHPSKKKLFDSDDDTRLSADLGAIKKSYGFDDEGVHITEKSPPPDERPFVPLKMLESAAPYEPPRVPGSFVSGSSPTHLSQRYLKWNQFGMVTSFSTTEENTIEVRWHDASVHSEMIIDNSTSRYSIADLSNELVVLASRAEIDSLSELRVHCIIAWDIGSREWITQMPSEESIDNVVIGGCFVALATNLRFIRIFSHAGTQIIVLSHPGPILTMCAAGKRLTTVAVNSGYFFEDDKPQFNMNANTYELTAGTWFKRESILSSTPLALSRNAALEWIGYSRGGMLCTMDSSYCVRLLTANGVWVPIHSFSSSMKSISDHVFLIGVVEYPHCELRYVYCKGIRYPPVASRLVPLVAPWNIPFCNAESEKSQLERKLLQSELLRCAFEGNSANDVADIQELCSAYTKDLMRLFALACKADRECRAAELALYAPSAHLIQSMCNFAAKTRHSLLVEKVAEIGRNNIPTVESRTTLDRRTSDGNNEGDLAPKPVIKRIYSSKRKLLDEGEEKTREAVVDDGDREEEQSADSRFDTSVSSEQNSFTCFSATKTAPNPFKRKAAVVEESQENIFDSLSSPLTKKPLNPPLALSNKSGKQKKEVVSRQSLLVFSP